MTTPILTPHAAAREITRMYIEWVKEREQFHRAIITLLLIRYAKP